MQQCEGEGQGSCKRCEDNGIWNRSWMCFLYKVDGYPGCYCRKCATLLEVPNRPEDLIEVIHHVPNKKLVGVVNGSYNESVCIEYEWDNDHWQKVANLGHDIALVKRKYGAL